MCRHACELHVLQIKNFSCLGVKNTPALKNRRHSEYMIPELVASENLLKYVYLSGFMKIYCSMYTLYLSGF